MVIYGKLIKKEYEVSLKNRSNKEYDSILRDNKTMWSTVKRCVDFNKEKTSSYFATVENLNIHRSSCITRKALSHQSTKISAIKVNDTSMCLYPATKQETLQLVKKLNNNKNIWVRRYSGKFYKFFYKSPYKLHILKRRHICGWSTICNSKAVV